MTVGVKISAVLPGGDRAGNCLPDMVHSEGNAGPVSCENSGCVRELWKRACRLNDRSSVRTREKNSSNQLGVWMVWMVVVVRCCFFVGSDPPSNVGCYPDCAVTRRNRLREWGSQQPQERAARCSAVCPNRAANMWHVSCTPPAFSRTACKTALILQLRLAVPIHRPASLYQIAPAPSGRAGPLHLSISH